jgi:hypothetical protein
VDLPTNTNLPLWGGSRQGAGESYIFGSKPRVQKGAKKDIIKRRESSRCKCPGSGVEGGGVDGEGEGRKGRGVEGEEERPCRRARRTSASHIEESHGGKGGKNEMDVEGEGDREGSNDVKEDACPRR